MFRAVMPWVSLVAGVAFGLLLVAPGVARSSELQLVLELLDEPVPADPPAAPPPEAAVRLGSVASELALVSRWSDPFDRDQKAPPEVGPRLLEAALEHPKWLPGVLRSLPQTEEAFDRVKGLYDRGGREEWFTSGWEQSVSRWLMIHSDHLRDRLVAEAAEAHDGESGSVQGREALEALWRLDPGAAAPLLERLATGEEPRTRALALALQYRRLVASDEPSDAVPVREALARVALDSLAPGTARNTALEALLETEWEGRDEWYLERFEDASLLGLRDGFRGYGPLSLPVEADPDRWIPVLAALVGSEDRTVHDHAVSLLVGFQLERARADALRPLLPWLFDPEWSSAGDRLRLIQSVDRVGLHEAVPGLIYLVESGDEYAEWAAESLAAFAVAEAVPTLRKQLAREKGAMARQTILRALLASGGFSTEEQVAALHAFSVQYASEEGQKAYRDYRWFFQEDEAPPVEVSLGDELGAADFVPTEALIGELLESFDRFESLHPGGARVLREILAQWSSPALDRRFVQKLAQIAVEPREVALFLSRRDEVRRHAAAELKRLLEGTGVARGLAAAFLGEALALEPGDPLARAAFLAGSRLARTELPVEGVAPLLRDPEPLVAQAAKRILEADDGPEAREALWSHFEGEARIFGHRMAHDPGHHTFGVFEEAEEGLRQEVLTRQGPDEIYALLNASYWGGAEHWIVRIRKGRARLECGRRSRDLDPDELEPILTFLEDNAVEDLPALDTGAFDGTQSEFLHLTPRGGRRLFMNNPLLAPGSVYAVLTALFEELECG